METTTMPMPSHPIKYSLPPENHSGEGLATFLGLFSIGLGLAEAVAPRSMARLIGVKDHTTILRAFGMRECATGVGILFQDRPAGWLWGRVAGDAMDLAFLYRAYRSDDSDKPRLATAAAAVAGVTFLDVACAWLLSRDGS